MSIFYRKENYHERLFLKGLHLKTCNKRLSKALVPNFTDEEYIVTFKECFPHLWEDIVYFCDTRKANYLRRKAKGYRTVPYSRPEEFLVKHAHLRNIIVTAISEVERNQIKEQLKNKGIKKILQRKEKLENNLVYVQEVCPPYVNKLIGAYYNVRKLQTLDVNARYLIILEASQFKCRQTLSFLYKINACDMNQEIRMMAFYALQRMGEHPWLGRGRKGKRHLSQVKKIDIQKNPTELLKLIRKYQCLLYQTFDFFISHSSRDENELLKIKSLLNRQGYTVYIDWVNDREMLNRENQDDNTWNALFLRMDQSRNLLYIMTDNSILSKYTKKEVEYFKAKKKSVFVYKPQTVSFPRPDYLKGCMDLNNINSIQLK